MAFVEKFMNATGKLRAVFGPAHRTSIDHDMTSANRELLEKRQAETRQWETLHRPDGSTYVVPKNPEDKSLR
ncbi:hypothetical protein [Arthrobacter globiformis]|uniref:Uncharacterized protein n=1 Tax=Arthrobacter globiformis TaxID=1665 RepID=A0A328HE01_ARTGO|nr:hypothetical protein [Arthrobacter globiformis]RAM36797.1 hypothetical protein DBZ45_13270 [Arthrobacter globiformis]